MPSTPEPRVGDQVVVTVRGRLRAFAARGRCVIVDTPNGALYVPVEEVDGLYPSVVVETARSAA